MCLLILAWKLHPQHDLIVVANRDEQHDRPTSPVDFWPDQPDVLAGRDLQAAGTWLAVNRGGRFAAVTNFREENPGPGGASRGELVTRFLGGTASPSRHIAALEGQATQYAGFNLLLGDGQELWYVSNRAPVFAQRLEAGVHALSNHLLGTAWPKLEAGVAAMRRHVDAGASDTASLLEAMTRRDVVSGPGALRWPASSGPFIEHEAFGTRSISILRREPDRGVLFEEHRFGPLGRAIGATRLSMDLGGTPA